MFFQFTWSLPEESVLDPFLFLLFINDIVNNTSVNIKLFADDCVLYNEIVQKTKLD